MLTHRSLLVLVASLTLTVAAWAQVPGPEFPELGKLTFGWVSMSGLDPTLDLMSSFAPSAICVRDAGFTTGAETAQGTFNFGDLEVESNFQSAITAFGPGVARISRYAFRSNTARVPGLPGRIRASGDAIELSYAQHVDDWTLGVSIVPQDSSKLSLAVPDPYLGTVTGSGEATTNYGLRLGGYRSLAHGVRVGADFSYQSDTSNIQWAAGDIVIIPKVEDRFITRCTTVGASWAVQPRTRVYGSYQRINSTAQLSEGRKAELLWFGVERQLSKTVALRANYLDGGANVMASWQTPYGMLLASYTHDALLNAEEVLGNGDSFFLGLDLAH